MDGARRLRGRQLPKRDYLLIPLVSLLTALVMVAAAEISARLLMPAVEKDSCLLADPVLGFRPRPTCVSRTKSAEGEWVENRYNDCGYRATTPCHAPLDHGSRIAVIGSSSSWGYHVPAEQTWYVRMAKDLSRRCVQQVDVQNLAGVFDLAQVASRVSEAVALDPSAVVMLVSPRDLEALPPGNFVPANLGPLPHAAPNAAPTGVQAIEEFLNGSRAIFATRHFIFRQPETYVALYLRNGDKADFLRPPFTPKWKHRLTYAGQALTYMAEGIHAAGKTFVVAFLPQQAQADIVALDVKPEGVDPYAVSAALDEIAHRHEFLYVDVTRRFANMPNVAAFFLNADGHVNGLGSALAAQAVEDILTGPEGPSAFQACRS